MGLGLVPQRAALYVSLPLILILSFSSHSRMHSISHRSTRNRNKNNCQPSDFALSTQGKSLLPLKALRTSILLIDMDICSHHAELRPNFLSPVQNQALLPGFQISLWAKDIQQNRRRQLDPVKVGDLQTLCTFNYFRRRATVLNFETVAF